MTIPTVAQLERDNYKNGLARKLRAQLEENESIRKLLEGPKEGEQMIPASRIIEVATRVKNENGFCEVVEAALKDMGVSPSQTLDVVINIELHARVAYESLETNVDLDHYIQEAIGVNVTRNGDRIMDVDLSTDDELKVIDVGDVYIESVKVSKVAS